jgi:hypothetical protein
MQNLKAEYAADNQGWRQAIAEKAKRELTSKEQELRVQLEAERDAQIELVRRRKLRTHSYDTGTRCLGPAVHASIRC